MGIKKRSKPTGSMVLCSFLLLFFSVSAGYAVDLTLQWDANTQTNLAGYYVYYKSGTCCEPYDGADAVQGISPIKVPVTTPGFDPANPEYTLTGLAEGTAHYFSVTAYDTEGNESGYSNEVKTGAPQIISPPSVTYLSNNTAVIEWTTDEPGSGEVQYGKNRATWDTYSFSSVVENAAAYYLPEPHPEHVEGAYSAYFESANNEHFILKSDAAKNMPWNTGSVSKDGTIWVKFRLSKIEKRPVLFAKYDRGNTGRLFAIYITPEGDFQVNLGYNSGTSFKSHFYTTILEPNVWYAARVVFQQNGGNNANPEKIEIELRTIQDGKLVATGYTANAFDDPDNDEIGLNDVPYTIGASLNSGTIENSFDGHIDELIVSNTILSAADFAVYATRSNYVSDARYACALRFESGEDFSNDATANNNDFTPGGSGPLLNWHSVILTGLDSNSDYFFRVGSTNDMGFGPNLEPDDSNPSAEYSFRTESGDVTDTAAPQIITQPYASDVTLLTAVIAWKTDEPATSVVEFGQTTAYGETAALISQYRTDHTVSLDGLKSGTLYHFRVKSTDGAGNTVVSGDNSFTTLSEKDLAPPQFTSAPTVTSITHNSFTVAWTTNENSDSQVQYGTVRQWWGNYPSKNINAEQVTKHTITITGLEPSTDDEEKVYYFRVGSMDSSGNGPTVSSEMSIKTNKAPDTKAPQMTGTPTVISQSYITETDPDTVNATIAWDTDEPGNSEVQYGTDAGKTWGDYSSRKINAEMVSHHVVTLTNLIPKTLYYFRVGTTDSSGNGPLSDSQDNNPSVEIKFITHEMPDVEAPQITTPPTVTAKTNSSITLEWSTSEPSNSIVQYGETSGTWGDYPLQYFSPEGVIAHRAVITGLKSETAYFFRVGGIDASNNGPDTNPDDNNPSSEISAVTQPDVDYSAPQIISPPAVTAKTDSVAVIEWETDEPSNSLVQYGESPASWGSYPMSQSSTDMVTRHQITLTNLSKSTTYYFRVGSVDEHGNGPETSFEISFATEELSDTAPPVITIPPTVTGLSNTSAAIEWETDEPSNSIVQYTDLPEDTAASLVWDSDNRVVANNFMVKRHHVTITNLSPGTRYQYRAGSTDAAGNGPVAGADEQNNPFTADFFTTEIAIDEAAPKILGAPEVSATDNQSVIIEWETDEPSNSIVKYVEQDAVLEILGGTTWEKLPLVKSDANMKTLHSMTITGLNPLTTYIFRVGSSDALGNGPDLNEDLTNSSVLGTFTTAEGPDMIAPIITFPNPDNEVMATFVSNKTALINWQTDEPSNSFVQYGTSSGLWGNSKEDSAMVKDHVVTITGLNPATTYYFRVGSMDAKGNGFVFNPGETNPSGEGMFETQDGPDESAPQVEGEVSIISITDKTAVIEWTTNEPGNSQVRYDTKSSEWGNYAFSENDAEMVTHHSVTITGLSPSEPGKPPTAYYLRVSSTDASGNNHATDLKDNNPSIEKYFITPLSDPPSIVEYGDEHYTDAAYPKIDYENNTIDITFDEPNMQNALVERNYIFFPYMNFLEPGNSIKEIGDTQVSSTYRLFFKAVPKHTIIVLTVSNEITDADDYAVIPRTIFLNDNDADGLPDDWEIENGLNPASADVNIGEGAEGDFDGDGYSNYLEFLNGTDPKSFSSMPKPPQILRTIPHEGAGVNTWLSQDTSLAVLISDSAGIDTTDIESVVFTITVSGDGDDETYSVNLSDALLAVPRVRMVKLNAEEMNEAVTRLWVAYDRSMEEIKEAVYPFDANIEMRVLVRNIAGQVIEESYSYKIESQREHDKVFENIPEIVFIGANDPDLDDPVYNYDTGIQLNSGGLTGARVIYSSDQPVTPFLQTANTIIINVDRIGETLIIQPPTIFTTPAKIIIPVSSTNYKINEMGIYLYTGNEWVLACDPKGNVKEGGDGWMVPNSRVNYTSGNSGFIEIKAYHTASIQIGVDKSTLPDSIEEREIKADADCFIETVMNY